MINFIRVFFFITVISILLPSSAFAATDRQPKTITGKVYNPDGSFAEGAEVSVTCAGHTLFDTVSQYGNYSVTYGDDECQQFDDVQVTAQMDGLVASFSTGVLYYKTNTLDDLYLSAVSVPEYNHWTAIIASSLSIIAFITLKGTLWKFPY